jgi:hypothetical protein
MTSVKSLTWNCTNQTTSWLVHSLGIFGARTNHGQTWTHKTHHGPDLGEATTFPIIVFSMPLHGATSKWHFVPGLPSGSPEIPTVGVPATLGPHNFSCRPPIVMKSKAKLYPLLRDFQQYAACHLHTRKSGQFPTFSGRESNCQFDS